ncbi:LytR/AlgR family response regulator transcription factor [Rufibacter hautae]|uniref:LytTR family transcriptional regulator n=1 Tax=Rufibacter hautae TaxID=2595005 RepID=A0A5B6TIL5_9BACT|nr:LytTR family DNA-binding domain-containing protein [Rufibacter hautae]KAA3440504.1 LytTR family transcriptional regulator [Rufibacter hautae]
MARYPDLKTRLAVAPVLGLLFRHVGEPASLIELLRNPDYYADLSVCIVSMWLLWEYNHWVIKKLDKRYSWLEAPLERGLQQILLGLGVTVLYVTLVSFVYNEFIMNGHRATVFNITVVFVTDVPVSFLIFLSLHLVYTLLRVQQEYEAKLQNLRQTAPVPEARPEAPARNIMAQQGKALVPVPLSEVAYLYKAKELTFLRTFSGKDYLVDETLEHFENTLPAESFFRLNRQVLAQMSAIQKFTSDGAGRLLISLGPPFKEEVFVSRRRTPEFNGWMREVAV